MKAYIAEVDWADEGDIFFFSVESEEILQALKELTNICRDLDLIDEEEMYWGTNEAFEFGPSDFLRFIDDAEDITEEELAVFKKFRVTGFDIYDRIATSLYESIVKEEWNGRAWVKYVSEEITEEDLRRIKPAFLSIYGEEDWVEVVNLFNNVEE